MNRIAKALPLLFLLFSTVFALPIGAKTYLTPHETKGDKTLSPYFFIKSDDPALDQLPLQSTYASVNVSGTIADVLITQVYKNDGKMPIEAIYVFPASTRAAVYGLKMTIGERVIVAKINKREEARRDYEKAREEGKNASLLEQQRPNVFQMSVANIMPGDEIKVELQYTELLAPTDKIYEFVYPTVAGPRYSNMKEGTVSPPERWVQHPYLQEGKKPTYAFDIAVNISAGMPIRELVCTSHKVKTFYSGASTARVILDPSEREGGNRDYILRYRLNGDRIQSGLLLYEGEEENFFLLMTQPPKRVTKEQIPGREYIFIIDVSGSMHGFPLEVSKTLMKDLIGKLRPTDTFNVLLFAGSSSLLSGQSLPATPENISRAIQNIGRQRGGGGTELLPALQRALSLKREEGFSRTIVIVTDGYVRVEEEAFDLIRKNLADANMFAFGIGTSVNRHIIEGIAHVGMGEPFIIMKQEEAQSKAEKFRTLVESPVLTRVKVRFKGFDVHDVEPASIPDLLADRPLIVFGKWRGKPTGKIILKGVSGKGTFAETINVSAASPIKTNEALRYLWARHRITLLCDYNSLRANDKRISEVTGLGLSYNLLTPYTSFVAIDSVVRNRDGKSVEIRQPLPLPQGVSNYAVGGVSQDRSGIPATAMKVAPSFPQVMREEHLLKNGKEQKAGAISVTMEKVTASGGLSTEIVTKTAGQYFSDMGKCFTRHPFKGKLVIQVFIGPDGKVIEVKILPGPVKEKVTLECIVDSVKRWVFPPGPAGRETKATILFIVGR